MKAKKKTPVHTAKAVKQVAAAKVAANGKAHETNERQPRVRTTDEVLEDWKWLITEAGPDDLNAYLGQHIAVVDRKILGSRKNSIKLRAMVAKKHNMHPESVVIFFVG